MTILFHHTVSIIYVFVFVLSVTKVVYPHHSSLRKLMVFAPGHGVLTIVVVEYLSNP